MHFAGALWCHLHVRAVVVVGRMSARVLITGATGLVGGGLMARCAADGLSVRVSTRRARWPEAVGVPSGVQVQHVESQPAEQDWNAALMDRDVVVHCAARVHVIREPAKDLLTEY